MENRNNRGGMRGPGMGRRPAEKSKDFKGTWMKIIRYCKRYLAVIVVTLICAVAGTILTILGPDKLSDLTKVITEGIATGIDMERIKSIGLTLVAFYAGSAILSFGQQFIMATVTQNVTKQLRSDISGKINRLPMAYYNKTSTGDVLSRVTNDVDMISQSMNQSIGNLRGKTLLHLRAASIHLDQASQLGNTTDLARFGRQICNMRLTEKRHQVMLAHGKERDVVNDYHFIMVLVEKRFEMNGRVLMQASKAFFVHTGHARRGFKQPFAVRVFANAFQNQAHALLYLCQIHIVTCHHCLPANRKCIEPL